MLTIFKFKECSFWSLIKTKDIFIYSCFVLFVLVCSCKQKNKCDWRTASALEKIDRVKCLSQLPANDSFYAQLRKFSLSFNPYRRQNRIPVLSPDYECLYLCPGDVRWAGDIQEGEYVPPSHPYLKWKTVQWTGDTLLADWNLFVENSDKDRWGKTLVINYYLDTISRKNYKFEYIYSSGNPAPDISFNQHQADSLLKSWGLTYQ